MTYNTTLGLDGVTAPPLGSNYFFVSMNLLLQDRYREKLDIISGYATVDSDCNGILNYTTCEFVAGIGEYEVTVKDNKVVMTSEMSPSFVALANNTAVNNTWVPALQGHPSTLSGLQQLLYLKWGTSLMYYSDQKTGGIQWKSFGAGTSAITEFLADGSSERCFSFLDPHHQIISSINKLMVYIGAVAAQESEDYLRSHLDEGLTAQSTTSGHVLNNHEVYHADYWFFLAAALVELVCIALVAPTCKVMTQQITC